MKHKVIITVLISLVFLSFISCKGTPKFSDVTGKEWLLIEVKNETQGVTFNRKTLDSEGFGNIFTLNFDAERLSGVGAPNRYTAPYTVGKNQVISVNLVAGTLMAPIREPERLKEQDYFTCLQNAYKWDLKDGKIEIYTKDSAGIETILVYSLGSGGK